MPTYDFLCETCDQTELDIYVSLWFQPHVMKCGHQGVKLMSRVGRAAANGYPYETSNITGSPIVVESPQHEAILCKEHGVVKRDDAAWINQEYGGYDFRRKRQIYKEGNGVGMPGCWT